MEVTAVPADKTLAIDTDKHDGPYGYGGRWGGGTSFAGLDHDWSRNSERVKDAISRSDLSNLAAFDRASKETSGLFFQFLSAYGQQSQATALQIASVQKDVSILSRDLVISEKNIALQVAESKKEVLEGVSAVEKAVSAEAQKTRDQLMAARVQQLERENMELKLACSGIPAGR